MNIEQKIEAIETRNRRVDADKAWEVSGARRVAIAMLVFLAAWGWLALQGSDTALRDALFPPLGYLLSTTALSALRVQWEARHVEEKNEKQS